MVLIAGFCGSYLALGRTLLNRTSLTSDRKFEDIAELLRATTYASRRL